MASCNPGDKAMSNTNTGGPAFPSSEWDGDYQRTFSTGGMTLRDYFAAKAMQGMMADGQVLKLVEDEQMAEAAYAIADAMLKVRTE